MYDQFMSMEELSTWHRDALFFRTSAHASQPGRIFRNGMVQNVKPNGQFIAAAYRVKQLSRVALTGLENARSFAKRSPELIIWNRYATDDVSNIARVPYFKGGKDIGYLNILVPAVTSSADPKRFELLLEALDREEALARYHFDFGRDVIKEIPPGTKIEMYAVPAVESRKIILPVPVLIPSSNQQSVERSSIN